MLDLAYNEVKKCGSGGGKTQGRSDDQKQELFLGHISVSRNREKVTETSNRNKATEKP